MRIVAFMRYCHRNRGLAQQAIQLVEEIHGHTNWEPDTISQEKGNCYWFEKMGYYQTEKINDNLTLVFYDKWYNTNTVKTSTGCPRLWDCDHCDISTIAESPAHVEYGYLPPSCGNRTIWLNAFPLSPKPLWRVGIISDFQLFTASWHRGNFIMPVWHKIFPPCCAAGREHSFEYFVFSTVYLTGGTPPSRIFGAFLWHYFGTPFANSANFCTVFLCGRWGRWP